MIVLITGIIWPVTAGILLGLFFFGGLWLTIRHTINRPAAGLWFSFSFILRIIISCAGIYFVAVPSPLRLLLCCCGFIVARLLLTRPRGREKAYAYKS